MIGMLMISNVKIIDPVNEVKHNIIIVNCYNFLEFIIYT